MSRLYLLRHGRTEANDRWLYCGVSDLPVSPAGLAELENLRSAGGYPSLEGLRVYTSSLLRTEQTLETLYGSVLHEVLPDLREMDFGDFELHSYEELKDRPDYQSWLQNPRQSCPNGESAPDMERRVLRAFQSVRNEDALLVCHGGTIAVILQHLFPDAGKSRYDWQPANGCGYALELLPDTPPRLLGSIPVTSLK